MAPSQSSEEVNRLLRMSIRQRQPITAMYNGRRRQLCPHRLGWNKDEERRVLCYQYGGESVTGLGQRLHFWRSTFQELIAVSALGFEVVVVLGLV
jgi:hypothetical protein